MTREEALERLLPNGPEVCEAGPYGEARLTSDTVFALQLLDALEKLGMIGEPTSCPHGFASPDACPTCLNIAKTRRAEEDEREKGGEE